MRDDGGMMTARATLCGQTAALARRAETLPPPLLAAEVEGLRRQAADRGMVAADRVCRAFTARLADARCRNGFAPWFQALEDAIGCTEADGQAVADACLAAIMVRMG